ncbi:MAG: protein translocase subunit SecF [Chloroflexi bacterium]|nr:protein translocase subunit SecF [Chloroflexota bacterium]
MFNFVRNRRNFYAISLLVMIPGLISLVLPGGLRPGIDFTSGTLMTIRFEQPVDQQELRDAFATLGHGEAVVQRSGDNTFVVRSRPFAQAQQGDTPESVQVSERQTVQDALAGRFGPTEILNLDQVSATIAEEIVRYAVVAVAVASAFILFYLAWAFRKVQFPWRYGSTAVIALVHDAVVVLGVFSILGRVFPIELEATFIVAVLTVIGFSVHDTIVVFDRIRENFIRHQGESLEDVVNHSLMQTIGRSLNTSLTVILTLTVLLLFGGVTIRTFVLALLVGITTGTYSSIFVASMLLVSWHNGEIERLFFWRRSRSPALPAAAA